MRKFLVIFNKNSGMGIKKSLRSLIIKAFKSYPCKVKFININYLKSYKNIDKYDTIVAVGGDGSVFNILSYVANTNKTLGIIPCGTANLFAAKLGIPGDIKKAVEIIFSGNTVQTDLGIAGDNYFALRVGAGYDAEIIRASHQNFKKKFGYLAYLITGITKSFSFPFREYRLWLDEKEFNVKANCLIVSNTANMFKKFCATAPNNSVFDGYLDVFIGNPKNILGFAGILLQILTNNHKNTSQCLYKKAKIIKIQTTEKIAHIDGETLSSPPIEIKIAPNALNVLSPIKTQKTG